MKVKTKLLFLFIALFSKSNLVHTNSPYDKNGLDYNNSIFHFFCAEIYGFPNYGTGAGLSFSSLTGKKLSGMLQDNSFNPRYAFGGELTFYYFISNNKYFYGVNSGLWYSPKFKFPFITKINYLKVLNQPEKPNILRVSFGYLFGIRKKPYYSAFGLKKFCAFEVSYGFDLLSEMISLSRHQITLRIFAFPNQFRYKPLLLLR